MGELDGILSRVIRREPQRQWARKSQSSTMSAIWLRTSTWKLCTSCGGARGRTILLCGTMILHRTPAKSRRLNTRVSAIYCFVYFQAREQMADWHQTGKYFSMSGRSQLHPSPQRTPVLFQAGTSKSGIAFAGRHAEAMFVNPCTVKQGKKVIAEARAAAAAEGRDPASLKFFPCIVPIIG